MKELPSRRHSLLREKKKVVMAALAAFLAAGSITIGTAIVPSDFEVPVLLANGEVITPPWYITVEGEKVALVDSEENAKKAIKKVVQHYKNDETVNIQIEEQTSTKEMKLKNGDPKPEILTAEEAAAQITAEKELTVKTTEIVTEEEPVKFKKVTQKTDKLYAGQEKVKAKGREGLKEVTKKITKENGQTLATDVVEENVLEEPENQIILTGTKENPEATYTASRGILQNGTASSARTTAKRGSGQLTAPVSSLNVTSGFGPRWGRTHLGVDLGLPTGSPIWAADNGTVIFAAYCGSYGNLVKLDHGNGMVTYYAHCSAFNVTQGQSVKAGQVIAKVGSTGNSTGPHLHFEVRINGKNVNPMNYL